MPGIQMFLLGFIVLVVAIGGGWFVYEANRDEQGVQLHTFFFFLCCALECNYHLKDTNFIFFIFLFTPDRGVVSLFYPKGTSSLHSQRFFRKTKQKSVVALESLSLSRAFATTMLLIQLGYRQVQNFKVNYSLTIHLLLAFSKFMLFNFQRQQFAFFLF